MTITDYARSRQGGITVVTVTSDLGGTIYYHWYLDGAYVTSSQSPRHTFRLDQSEQARIEVIDTNDPDYDPIGGAPEMFPGRYTLWWVRSLSSDVKEYRVEIKEGLGDWEVIATVPHSETAWSYQVLTSRLTDGASYSWRVIPVDLAGNDGTAINLEVETVHRVPDAPNFAISFDSGTSRVTFSEAS